MVLSLAGSLVFIAVGVSSANVRSYTSFERSLFADLYIGSDERGFEEPSNSLLFDIKQFDEVAQVEPLVSQRIEQEVFTGEFQGFVGFRVADRELSPLMIPVILDNKALDKLSIPSTTILAKSMAERLQVKVGDTVLSGPSKRALKVVGILNGELGRVDISGGSENSFISAETANLLNRNRDQFSDFSSNSLLLIRIKKGVDLELFKTKLDAFLEPLNLKVISSTENQADIAFNQIVNNKQIQGFIVVAAFAVFIPLIIVTQTLKNAITSQTTQFATLRALGVPLIRLIGVAMEQALWVGLISAGLAFSLTSLIKIYFFTRGIILYISLGVVIPVGLALIAASLIAGMFSILAILKASPVDLLR